MDEEGRGKGGGKEKRNERLNEERKELCGRMRNGRSMNAQGRKGRGMKMRKEEKTE